MSTDIYIPDNEHLCQCGQEDPPYRCRCGQRLCSHCDNRGISRCNECLTDQRRIELAQVVVQHRWRLPETPEEDDPSVIVWAGRPDLPDEYDLALSEMGEPAKEAA